MSEGNTETEILLSGNQPGRHPANKELSVPEELAEIQKYYASLVNPDADQRRDLIGRLKKLTNRMQPPERPGTLHHMPETPSANTH